MALLPILTTVIPGPKTYMAVPRYVTKEHMRCRDVAVKRMENVGSSFVRVAHCSLQVVMIIS